MILYDVAHGGPDSGASANGLREKDVVLEICKLAAAGTRALGHHTGLTRTEDVGLSEARRKMLITDLTLTGVVSVHCNAFWTPRPFGWEIFVSQFNEESRQLGLAIARSLMSSTAIPPRNPPVKTSRRANGEDFYYVINEPTKVGTPAVLVEVGFLTNIKDADYLRNFWGRFSMAYLISAGVDAYLSTREGQTC